MVNYRPENSHFYWFFRYVHHVHRRYRSNLFPLISSDLSFLSIFDWTSWTYLKAPKNGIKRPFSLATACPPPGQRIKSLCGAKPPQKLRWTHAGRWSAIGTMEISPTTFGARADDCGSACLVCVARRLYRGWERLFQDHWQRHLEQSRGNRLRYRQGVSVACRGTQR